MSEDEPIRAFEKRRVARNVPPHSPEFREDTSRMSDTLDALSEGMLRPGFVKVSSFAMDVYQEADRPITPEDSPLLSEIVRLRAELTYEASVLVEISQGVNQFLGRTPPDVIDQKPSGIKSLLKRAKHTLFG